MPLSPVSPPVYPDGRRRFRNRLWGRMSGNVHRLDFAATRRHDADARASSAPAVGATNVVPFTRPSRETGAIESASMPALITAERPAPYRPARDPRLLMAGLLALSLLVHSGLYFIFQREPEPLVSIGLEAISVEIVVGSNSAAGAATAPGEAETQTAPPEEPQRKPETEIAKVEPDPPPAEEPPSPVTPEEPPAVVAAEDTQPAQPVEPPAEPEQQVAALPVEETPAPRAPDVAAVPVEPTEHAKPENIVPPKPPEPKPVQQRETKPVAKPKPEAKPKPKQERADRPTRTASREPAPVGPRAHSASGVGPGRSQNDT